MRPIGIAQRRSALIAARAHGLRLSPTLSERKLWSALSARRLLGVVFRRQVPLGDSGFIGDFVAPALKLVVEVEGSIHQHKRRADARREEKLRRLGYRVLRLDAEMVMRDLPSALVRIREEVMRISGGGLSR
jgi:very-short-patch-repair endonuclease